MFEGAFLVGDDLTYLVDTAIEWLAYGIGFGAVLWMIGRGVGLIFYMVRY